jgi:hypothetical protein
MAAVLKPGAQPAPVPLGNIWKLLKDPKRVAAWMASGLIARPPSMAADPTPLGEDSREEMKARLANAEIAIMRLLETHERYLPDDARRMAEKMLDGNMAAWEPKLFTDLSDLWKSKEPLWVRVEIENAKGDVIHEYTIDHNDPQHRRVLGEQCREAFEGNQGVFTYPTVSEYEYRKRLGE